MDTNANERAPTVEQKQLARAALRRAIDRAVTAGIAWQEIVRTLAELGPDEEPSPLDAPSHSSLAER
jgi:hypothetical protein